MSVRPKKNLGQHFLVDLEIAKNIVQSLTFHTQYVDLLEIGPGTGVLTQYLLQIQKVRLTCVELDVESVEFLLKKFPDCPIIHADVLSLDLKHLFSGNIGIIGNFPYNISSQIFFKILDAKDKIPEVVCMLQKEVAERLCSLPCNKAYGLLSVLLQAWYDLEYLFTVHEHVFDPPPKVKSGVIRLRRNSITELGCNETLFRSVVKQAFSMRRKTMRNAFKSYPLPDSVRSISLFDKRAEELSWKEFVYLTNIIYPRA